MVRQEIKYAKCFRTHSEGSEHSMLVIRLYIGNAAKANDTERFKVKE